jgi:hypothetical protein
MEEIGGMVFFCGHNNNDPDAMEVTIMITKKPDSADIASVIEDIEAGMWLHDCDDQCWLCVLYNCDGQPVGNGIGLTSQEAVVYTWIAAWDPDALIHETVRTDMPTEIDDEWLGQIELFPPGTWTEEDTLRRSRRKNPG